MKDSKRSYPLATQLGLTFFILTNVGCSTMVDKKGSLFEPDHVKSMQFRFDQPLKLFGARFPDSEIATRIAGNLAEWGYSITAQDSRDFSHSVTVTIDGIKRSSTPTGFSFSSGNSDPRSIDFQKADVIPVTCSLIPKEQPEQSAELTMVFNAKDYLDYSRSKSPRNKLTDLLIDNASTVCFNLLRELKIDTQPIESSESKGQPGWFPEIRVEVENDTETETIEQPPSMKKPTSKEPRKHIVIHNQGSPVIFKFGHERK